MFKICKIYRHEEESVSLATLEKIIASGVKLTPMMQQYYSIKKIYSDLLLLFRMGDFYEVFFDDAKETAKLLNITLTHRGKLGDFPIPMAGIPHHAASTYIDKLTAQGKKVAICEQLEDPGQAKGIVKRGVSQIVGPCIPYDLDKLSPKESHYLMALGQGAGSFALVALDFTTGEFFGHLLSDHSALSEKIASLRPKELLTYFGQWEEENFLPANLPTIIQNINALETFLAPEYFQAAQNHIHLAAMIPNFQNDQTLQQSPALLGPLGALGFYLSSTQNQTQFAHLRSFRLAEDGQYLRAHITTLQGLEILPKSRELYHQSLLGLFDRCQTAMGSRLLKKIFLQPLRTLPPILLRQQTVNFFFQRPSLLASIRSLLAQVYDLERIFTKISTKKAAAVDVLHLAHTAAVYHQVRENLGELLDQHTTAAIGNLSANSQEILPILAQEINQTLNDEMGASLEKGNLIREGVSSERDRLAKIFFQSNDYLNELEKKYREETNISNLKIRSNNLAGFYIEISKSHLAKVPAHFLRRQTLVNSERYQTPELADFENEVMLAQGKLERLEREIFQQLIVKICDQASLIMELADFFSQLDLYTTFAHVAYQEEFICPQIDPHEKIFQMQGGFHPLIKAQLRDQFISHDLCLNQDHYFGLITGPNMAGKTTVMREVAIMQFLAQIGSFVPAQQLTLGLCDYLFSRLGAHDDITRGQSTFMVEMTETAEIVRHASSRSLVILDEVGRGTSTYDGLSIAWSLVEHLVHRVQALTLFATHYHELIELVEQLPGAKNFTVDIANYQGKIQFLYRLVEKAATQSFGIYVAQLAGMPESLLNRAKEILQKLEKHTKSTPANEALDLADVTLQGIQLSFIGNTGSISKKMAKVEREIRRLDINQLTPLQAMQKLNELRDLL